MNEYNWPHRDLLASHHYLLPAISGWVAEEHRVILDIGCGNGALTEQLANTAATHADQIVGLDGSLSGVTHAQSHRNTATFEHHLIDNPLPPHLTNIFDLVIAAEVIEHLFLPGALFKRANEALKPNGTLIITTPEHNYWKNLALALTNRLDEHWDPLADYGHIKFFSQATLHSLAAEEGFTPTAWQHVGRFRPFAKSLCAKFARK